MLPSPHSCGYCFCSLLVVAPIELVHMHAHACVRACVCVCGPGLKNSSLCPVSFCNYPIQEGRVCCFTLIAFLLLCVCFVYLRSDASSIVMGSSLISDCSNSLSYTIVL